MAGPMNTRQEVIYDIFFTRGLLNAQRVAYRLHRSMNYLSDICRREGVDPFAVCIAKIEAHGVYDEQDHDALAEFHIKAAQLPPVHVGVKLRGQRPSPPDRSGVGVRRRW